MNEIKEIITKRYLNVNFTQLPSPAKNILCFRNDFSVHFIFLFEDLMKLEENWEENHNLLIKNYLEYDGPRYMEWNYYAVFIVTTVSIDEIEWNHMCSEIEANTSYSRKYLLKEDELSELPPGMINTEELKSKKVVAHGIRNEWEKVLGPDLYNRIINGPKASLAKRIRDMIEDKIEI